MVAFHSEAPSSDCQRTQDTTNSFGIESGSALQIIDKEIDDLLAVAEAEADAFYEDAESFLGLEDAFYEDAEFFCGLGFVGCQKYLVDTAGQADLHKSKALTLGEKLGVSNHTVVELIDAVANYWKHQAEWPDEADSRKPWQQATARLMGVLGVDVDSPSSWYPCSNALAAILGEVPIPRPHRIGERLPPRFEHLLPHLEKWRDALPRGTGSERE